MSDRREEALRYMEARRDQADPASVVLEHTAVEQTVDVKCVECSERIFNVDCAQTCPDCGATTCWDECWTDHQQREGHGT